MSVSKDIFVSGWLKEAKVNAGQIMTLGVLSLIAGVFSLIWPWASGIGVTIAIGIALVVGGITRLAGDYSAGSFGRGTLAFIGGALTVLAGLILIFRPGVGLATMTLLLGSFLMVDGIFGAVLAFQIRPEKGWGWVLFSAVMSSLLGILLLSEWPLSGFWAIGTLFGINMVFAAISMMTIGSAVRRL